MFRHCLLISCFSLLLCISLRAQYYLRGEVKDEKGQLLPEVDLFLYSKGTIPFRTGATGCFGIPTRLSIDTLTLKKQGFETLRLPVVASRFQNIVFKRTPESAREHTHRLSSLIRNRQTAREYRLSAGGETYNSLVENGFVSAGEYPETGFSLNVDRAAYSNIRRFINLGNTVPPDAVRIEEMLNYFSLNDHPEEHISEFVFKNTLSPAPYGTGNHLLTVNMQAPTLDMSGVPSSNFVFLIDVSGSMDKPNRLPLVQSALKLLIKNLRSQDTVSMVVYGGTIGILLPPTGGDKKDTLIKAVESLVANGDTNGEGAIRLAYTVARKTFIKGGNNRVILATDGDFNVGQVSEKDLEDLIVGQRNSGVYLTCLGVGMGNYKDSKLETLAKKGNGNFAYLDNYGEAEKVMVQEFSKTMYAVAADAFATVQFDPAQVKEYRLIGFDNRQESLDDASAAIEGGEIGSGHIATAIFQLRLSPDVKPDKPLGQLTLHYKNPGANTTNHQIVYPLSASVQEFSKLPPSTRLHTALAMFGMLVKQSPFAAGLFSWDLVLAIAREAVNLTDPLQNEFLKLIEKASRIYGKGGRR